MRTSAKFSNLLAVFELPLRSEAVFFVLLLIMWGPYTWLALSSCLFSLTWQSPFYNRLIYFASYTFLFSYLCTAAVSFTRWRWLKVALYIVSLLNFGTYLFLKFNFHTMLTPDVLQAVLETNPSESADFWRQYLLARGSLMAYAGVLVMVAVIVFAERWWSQHGRQSKPSVWLGGCVLVGLLACCWCLRPFIKMLRCQTVEELEVCEIYGSDLWGGDNFTTYAYSVHTLRVGIGEIQHALEVTCHELDAGKAQRLSPNDSLTVVVVIGETYIKSHCGLYGYSLNTTPRMNRERAEGNLWVFEDVISPFNYTSISLKNALSCNSIGHGERWSDTPLLMAVMRRAGFDVYAWDNQLNYFKGALFSFALNGLLYNERLRNNCYTAVSEKCFDYDEQLVDDYLNSQWNKQQTKAKLVTFHLMGQHFKASERYPHEQKWQHFTADSVRSSASWLTAEKRQEIAEYDNATRYNDHVLGRIFDAWRDKNAVVIYFADHGEEIYDWRDFAGRDESSNKLPEAIIYQNSVPMVVWCSNRYLQLHPNVNQRLEQGRIQPLMHDNVCQIIFNLAQVVTPFYHPDRDPLSDQFRPSKRLVYDHIDYDSLFCKP